MPKTYDFNVVALCNIWFLRIINFCGIAPANYNDITANKMQHYILIKFGLHHIANIE